MAIAKSNKQKTLTWPKQGYREWWMDTWTLGTQLEKDSLKKSLNSQSSLGSCFSLAPQGVSLLIKWARELLWTRWRSINNPHQVQGPANRFPLKTGAPDAHNVAPDALHRASGDTLTANSTFSDSALDAPSVGQMPSSSERENLHPPWVWDRTLPDESGASVRCPGQLQTSLGMRPDAPRWVRCERSVPNPRHPVTLTKVSPTRSAHRASDVASGASLGTQTSSELDLSKTKFVSLDLRTFSELPSARFTKCAPHLNLKPCLGQGTRSMPP